MITKAVNKFYAGQIAGIFCEDAILKNICKTNVKNRIINNFTDEIFEEDFLTGLDTSIFRAITGVFRYSSPGYMKFVMNSTDIVNGKNKVSTLDGIPYNKAGDWVWIVGHLNKYYESVAPNLKAYHLGIVNNKLIWQIDGVSDPYGIIFIPGTVGNGGGGNGGGGNGGGGTGGGGQCPEGFSWFAGQCFKVGGGIKVKPPEIIEPVILPGEVDPGGVDFQKLLIPVVIVAGAYLLLN